MARAKKGKGAVLEVGTCLAMPQRDDRFTACQILSHHAHGGYEVIVVDWMGRGA